VNRTCRRSWRRRSRRHGLNELDIMARILAMIALAAAVQCKKGEFAT